MSITDPAPMPSPMVGRPPRTREEWDVPAEAVAAQAHLRSLLAAPPAGHTPTPQPPDWYEAVFDDMAACCPNPCPPKTDTTGGAL